MKYRFPRKLKKQLKKNNTYHIKLFEQRCKAITESTGAFLEKLVNGFQSIINFIEMLI